MRRALELALLAGAAACFFRAGQAWASTPRPVELRFRHVAVAQPLSDAERLRALHEWRQIS